MSLLGSEGDEGDGSTGPLLPPDDRLWRHPSELMEAGRPVGFSPGRSRPRHPRLARPALTVTTGLLLGAGLTATAMLITRPSMHGGARTALALDGAAGSGASGASEVAPGQAAASDGAGAGGRTVVTVGLEQAGPSSDGSSGGGGGSRPSDQPGALAAVSPGMTAGARRARRSLVQVESDKGGAQLAGYGVEMSTPGVVLTTDSLVDGVDEVSVIDAGGNRLMATVVGVDPVTDVGVLKVETTSWTPMGISPAGARSDQVVSALTAPNQIYLGRLDSTWVNADVPGHQPMLGALSSDVPVPADAVGAPLVDQTGLLVGVVGAVGVDRTAVLAIPGSTAAHAVQSLLTTGAVPHGWIGVERASPASGGVRIEQVDDGAPAARAGMATGDVIAAVDGQVVATVDDLWAAIRLRRPGTTVTMTVIRGPGRATLEVTLGDLAGH